MILFRKNPPGVSPPAASKPRADDLPDPLTMALINVDEHNLKMALTHFNDALADVEDDKHRAEVFQKFGQAVAGENRLLGETYLSTALALAVSVEDDALADAISKDLLLLGQS